MSIYVRQTRRCQALSGAFLIALLYPLALFAQTGAVPTREERRARVNTPAVTLVAGHPDSTLMRIASDLAIVTEQTNVLRVVPVAGDGAAGNIRDVIFLRNIDMGLTDLAALERMRLSGEITPNLTREIAYIAPLFEDKLQLIAQKDIRSVEALRGKVVNLGREGSSEALHGRAILDALNIPVQAVYLPQPDAAEKLVRAEIDATLCFCLSSPGFYQRVMFEQTLRVVPIPLPEKLPRGYQPAKLDHTDYPAFVRKGESVDTVSVTVVLIAFNWQKGELRYDKVATFTDRFLTRFAELKKPPRHPGWIKADPNAPITGWRPFPAAQEWRVSQEAGFTKNLRFAFEEFLGQQASKSPSLPAAVKPQQQNQLFEDFLKWQQTRQ